MDAWLVESVRGWMVAMVPEATEVNRSAARTALALCIATHHHHAVHPTRTPVSDTPAVDAMCLGGNGAAGRGGEGDSMAFWDAKRQFVSTVIRLLKEGNAPCINRASHGNRLFFWCQAQWAVQRRVKVRGCAAAAAGGEGARATQREVGRCSNPEHRAPLLQVEQQEPGPVSHRHGPHLIPTPTRPSTNPSTCSLSNSLIG